MSNVKKVLIAGDVPYDLGGGNEDGGGSRNLRDCILQFVMPTVGVRIEYGATTRKIPIPGGGLYTMTAFIVSGEEALSSAFLQKFCSAVWDVGGQIAVMYEEDTENREVLEKIILPEAVRECFAPGHNESMLRQALRRTQIPCQGQVLVYVR